MPVTEFFGPLQSESSRAQRVVNGRGTQQVWDQHRCKAGADHRQKYREASSHLRNENDAGNRSLNHAGKEGCHSSNGEGSGLESHIGEGNNAKSTDKQTELRSQDKDGSEQAARRRRRI